MWYLFLQIWIWLLAAFILGWFAHWFFCCRDKKETSIEQDAPANQDDELTTAVDSSWKPMGFTTRPEQVDDLKRIKGVGAVIQETLNGLGVYQFSQIAEWTEDNISWVEDSLSFPGRIEREEWIQQAKTLAQGGTTEFASRVDKGDVDYD